MCAYAIYIKKYGDPSMNIIYINLHEKITRFVCSEGQDENAEPSKSSPAAGSSSRNVQTAGILNLGLDGRPVIETVSAYQVRQQKEEEIRRNDQLWIGKLRELESKVSLV